MIRFRAKISGILYKVIALNYGIRALVNFPLTSFVTQNSTIL
jgi:hypothetical protein